MSKEVPPVNGIVPETVTAKIYGVLSDAALKKATAYIRKYETETDALLLNKGLIAIKNMLHYAIILTINVTDNEFSLIVKELKLRIEEVNTIIMKLRGKRPLPIFSDNDKKTIFEIEQALKNIFGTKSAISFGKITPLLLEASGRKKR